MLVVDLARLSAFINEEEAVPQDFKSATIITIYKNKGDRRMCDDHRGISVLSVAGKQIHP